MTALERRRNAASLRAGRQFAEAEAELRQAISDSPTDADAHAELGLTLSMAGRPAEATLSYEAAIALSPNDIFALSNLAATLKLLNRAAEAEAILRQVLALEPENDAALRNLAALLRDSGRWAEAKALYLRAAAAGPRLELSLQAHLGLAPVVRSGVDAEAQRADFVRGLDAFAADPRTFDYAGERLSLPWYYLPYQGVSNRRLLERTAEVVTARVPGAAYAADLAHWRDPRTQGRRIRIAVCSQFLRAHTIGRLYRGLIRDLDRTRFEVVVLHAASSGPDADREALDRLADRAVKLPDDLEGQRTLIAELAPDVLFYPDIGMSAQTWFLAAGRLAPVQATSWGHPETTGLPSIDYFVSCDL
ncbi:MAG: tetratricopeptide repeat protein, partial [Phenylobacterium sp.]